MQGPAVLALDVQGPAVLALDVPCPLPAPSLFGYERSLRFFLVICMAIAQVSVTPRPAPRGATAR